MTNNMKNMDVGEYSTLLDRNIGFINNCDTKTSIGLAVNGAMVSFILSIMNDCQTGNRSGLFFIPLMMLMVGAACFVYTLWARYELTEKSGITVFWNCSLSMKEEKEKLASLTNEDLKNELLEQIVINAKLAKLKYEWYNSGLLCTIAGSAGTIILTLGNLIAK